MTAVGKVGMRRLYYMWRVTRRAPTRMVPRRSSESKHIQKLMNTRLKAAFPPPPPV